MKAVQIEKNGSDDVVKLVNIPKPSINSNQVLVEVYAASVNPFDWKFREGIVGKINPGQFPVTLGGDFSGKIIKTGSNVSNFKTGDSVYGFASVLRGGSGAFAEFAAADSSLIGYKPKQINFSDAAAIPMAGIRAWMVIFNYLQLKKDQKILIHGGGGGIGSFAVQLAKFAGAYVATTCNMLDIELVKSLGANEVIDYKKDSFELILKDYDAVFDNVGGEIFRKSFKILKPGGTIVSMLEKPDDELSEKYNFKYIQQNREIDPQAFSEISDLLEKKLLKIKVGKIFSLGNIQEALRVQEKEHVQGKLVIIIKDEN